MKKTCLISANCQGRELQTVLLSSSSFAKEFEVIHCLNYENDFPADIAAESHLYLYQHLGAHWKENATKNLFSKASSQTRLMEIPNFYFTLYAPTVIPGTSGDFWTDFLLDRLIAEHKKKSLVVSQYINNFSDFIDLDCTLDTWTSKARKSEERSPVKTVDWILERWKGERLFYSYNHPKRNVTLYVAKQILHLTGHPPLSEEVEEAVLNQPEYYAGTTSPVHPQVASFFALEFYKEKTRYQSGNKKYLFTEYVDAYVDSCLRDKLGILAKLRRAISKRLPYCHTKARNEICQ